ncbi:hypothetical protein E6P09_11675 [Haloferax mediterranei ATCC 33500]|uniref:Uncharacterized protein n=1 Tax=Haloferax mediterranei (strain ATCC 33500 / DSM 1411 / JCM 8866 / NBRC 14739 / NCIMB 2177 / R-4) TaxID=523841 RepID=M0J8P4_HALMT|nr:hypothetical protein [Haloferax mediterranei]AHZ21213.1 hypothetical protein BM92_00455 [Haloferax mediterranei ATCC 33500]EMA04374.1 hypothetical protein C439_01827 [Haloferax mediterranei ATCC 33500]MDX5989541.1 hypothetical protein [Haloferax mediterranei ATCC 33500]QCQ76657.1 hypothetical protein E6P09_11675 [Haloferax mediterranei ATCC 33500]
MDAGADADADHSTPTLVAVAYALLFSVPVGVGVTVMMTRVVPGRLTEPLVVGPGFVIALAVFALVVAAARGGENTA